MHGGGVRLACSRAPQVNQRSGSPVKRNSSQTYPTRVVPDAPSPIRFQCIVRSLVPNVDSRLARRFASNRNGSSSSSALDLPLPLGPRSSSRPWWNSKTSS